ncbi:hypothetical protein EBT16_00530 [bacterium]|nr:hypothetical protein [bacterium]
MNFKPTHVIETEAGETIKLMLVGKEAYMGHQWAESAVADYRLENGAWTYGGRPAKIKAEPAQEEAVDGIEMLR